LLGTSSTLFKFCDTIDLKCPLVLYIFDEDCWVKYWALGDRFLFLVKKFEVVNVEILPEPNFG